jgi:hypothetical protein
MTLEELEKKVKELDDIENIKKLHRQYIYLLNSHKWEEIVNCFTDDGIADIGRHGLHKGREELSILFGIKIAKVNENWHGAHFVTQPIIFIEGDKATGYWMLYIFVFEGASSTGPIYRWLQGRHDCEYIKENGEWKIRALKYTRPWPAQVDLGFTSQSED